MTTFKVGDRVTVPTACGGTHVGETALVVDTERFPGMALVSFGGYSEPFKPGDLQHA